MYIVSQHVYLRFDVYIKYYSYICRTMGNKLNNSDATNFIYAGNSIFTVLNSKTSNRFTYKVKKSKDGTLYFVSVLSGPECYTYLGIIGDGTYRHGTKSVISKDAQSVKVFDYVLNKLKNNKLPEFVEVWHEGKCGKCGRALTVPSSILTGIGPECSKKLSKEEKRDKVLTELLS
jgi:hypothetical protein